MATLSGVSLIDVAKITDPNGSLAVVAELLTESNPIIEDVPMYESNQATSHQITLQTSLPTAAYVSHNEGSQPSKGTTDQVTEPIGMLESWGQVAKTIADLNGNTAAFRAQKAVTHVEAMAQEFAGTLIYGDHSLNSKEFTGLAKRRATPGDHCLDIGASNDDNTSIYLAGWGPGGIYGIYPKGSSGGLEHVNLGLETATDSAGKLIRVYRDQWIWKHGIALEDPRCLIRAGSIDVSSVMADTAGSSIKLLEIMLKMLHKLPERASLMPVFYVPACIAFVLDAQAMNKANVNLVAGMEEGKPKTRFRGIPIKKVDQILETEIKV
jgi:hypothetical protein